MQKVEGKPNPNPEPLLVEFPLDNRSWDVTARREIYEEVYNAWRYPNLRLYYVNAAVTKKERLLAMFTP